METKENIPPQEDLAHLSPWTHSKLLQESKLLRMNFPPPNETQQSQLETSSARPEYRGAPKPFPLLLYHPKHSPALQFCSALTSWWTTAHFLSPSKEHHCAAGLWGICCSLWHKGVEFCFMFPSFWAFIFKVPGTHPGSLRTYQGQFKELCTEQEGAPVQSCSFASAREEQIQTQRGHFTYL